MTTSTQLHSELDTLEGELKSVQARMLAITDERSHLEKRSYEVREFIKDKKSLLRKAQEREWKPTKDWPKGIEFIVKNSKGELFPAKDKWGGPCFKDFVCNGEGPRWRTEKTAQLQLGKALEFDRSAKLLALPMNGENEEVLHRPIYTV